MEGLHLALKDALHSNLFQGAKVGDYGFCISHFFYADDVVIASDWNHRDMENIIRVLQVSDMARVTGCAAGSMPFTYLGLPIGSNMSRIANWKKLVDMFRSKLSLWKANLLSIGGRLTLIKAVLGSIAIHGSEGGYDEKGCNTRGLWSKIVDPSNYLHSNGIIPMSTLKFKVGCGSNVRFWKDTWLGDGPLNRRYNRLFRLDRNEDCCIIDRISNGEWSWDWNRHDLGGRNADSLNLLLAEIGNANVGTGEDSWHWNLSDVGMFTVGVTRKHIDNFVLPSMSPSTRWNKSLPRKVNIFVWRLLLDRLPHRVNLSSRGLEIPSIVCPVCNAAVETSDHIFYACDTASNVWRQIRAWCDVGLPCFYFNMDWIGWLDN
ncbi:putative RNA-directed DNA polymerase, eukaryota, reverse transcriptase zinc-binding domain protein [Tanacetum coccineum]|uniref:RNA-directed DNA polymerase, eukaryota, reverse transcriptase zinc-binding domain protein n=1 Tax=Tanacetum coccineum TaxID=301880 RepID=A0ABQ5FEB2_9ASTR